LTGSFFSRDKITLMAEIEKEKALTIGGIIQYVPNSVVIKNIIKKTSGRVNAVSFDVGQTMVEKIIPFDTFIQVIDGQAHIEISEKLHVLETGQAIIIPAHAPNTIRANVRFKMISMVIKSGYEDVPLI